MATNASQVFKDDELENQGKISDDELRHVTGIGKAEEAAREQLAREGNDSDLAEREGSAGESGSDSDSKAAGGDKLRSGEEKAGGQADKSDGGIFNEDGDNQSGVKGKLQNARGKIKKTTNNKFFVGGGIGVGAIVLLVLALVIVAGALKLPDVMQNIEDYEFAEVAAEFSQSAIRVTDTSLSMEGTSDTVYSKIKSSFAGKYTDVRNSTWGRLDAYRPEKVIQTLGDNNGLELRYKPSKIPGRADIWTGGSFNGDDFDVKELSGAVKWIPGIRQIVQAKNSAIARGKLLTAINEQLSAGDNPTAGIVRGGVFRIILKETNGGLGGLILNHFTSDDEEENQDQATSQMQQATQQGDTIPDNAATSEISEADETEEAALEKDAQDPTTLDEIVKAGGDDQQAEAAVDKVLTPNLTQDVSNHINPLFGIVFPICIIYDGSVQRSGPAIDDQTNEQMDSFDQLAAEADQEKTGDQSLSDGSELSRAINGASDEVGDISQSIPYQQAAGETPNTSDIVSSEAGSDGSYSFDIYNALGISASSLAGKILSSVTSNTCQTLTNTYVVNVTTGVTIITTIVTLGTSTAAEDTAGEAARGAVSAFVSNFSKNAFSTLTSKIVEKDGVKTIERGALNRAMRFAFEQGLKVGGTIGATEIAHLLVASRSGEATSGLAQGSDLVNDVGSGGNLEAGEVDRQQLFGRPLDESEVENRVAQTNSQVVGFDEQGSLVNRYLNIDNANSLVSRVGLELNTSLSYGRFRLFTGFVSSLLNPTKFFGSILKNMGVISKASAAVDPTTEDYGNVQFGWSQDEESLVDNNTSYAPLENQQILDNSGNEAKIAAKYAPCFGYTYTSSGNGDIDPTDTSGDLQPAAAAGDAGSLGTLLSQGMISRDSQGNVTGSGLCSPSSLSYDNTSDPLAVDDEAPSHPDDMIFRWRLAMQYDTTLDQLIGEQSVSN